MKKSMAKKEAGETPEMEVKAHSKGFLKKALSSKAKTKSVKK